MAVSSLQLLQCIRPLSNNRILGSSWPRFYSCRFRPSVVSSTASSTNLHIVKSKKPTTENDPLLDDSLDEIEDDKEVIQTPERDFTGTAYVPVYVMLPLGVINMDCELVDPESLRDRLQILKSANVDGVMIDCWWGIVEGTAPQVYNWSGYKELFQIVREVKLKLQVVMSFHECGGNVGDDIHIPLPNWVIEIGEANPDIHFTDREGRRNTESLTWGIDKECVLKGRTAVEVLNAAWDSCIPVAKNALPCYDREGYNKILENAKPFQDPDGRHLSVFTYLRLSRVLLERHNLTEFERFVKRMHGEAV